MSSVSKPRVRQNRHKQGLNQTLEKISADFRYNKKGRINKQNEKCLSDFTSEKRLFQKKIC